MQHVGVDCVLLVMVLGFHSIVEGGSLLLTSVRCIMARVSRAPRLLLMRRMRMNLLRMGMARVGLRMALLGRGMQSILRELVLRELGRLRQLRDGGDRGLVLRRSVAVPDRSLVLRLKRSVAGHGSYRPAGICARVLQHSACSIRAGLLLLLKDPARHRRYISFEAAFRGACI